MIICFLHFITAYTCLYIADRSIYWIGKTGIRKRHPNVYRYNKSYQIYTYNCSNVLLHVVLERRTESPIVWATFCKKSREGFKFPDSKRAIADCFVPIFLATSACVILFFMRASINCDITAYLGTSLSYSFFTAGSFNNSFFTSFQFLIAIL